MDEKLSILTLIKKHWRKFLIVFIICFGIGLLFSIKQVFPVFFDMIVINPHFNDQENNLPTHQPLTFSEPEPPNYKVYLPIVSTNESNNEASPIQVPDDQRSSSVTQEDPLFDINFKEGSPPLTLVFNPDIEQNHAITPVEITFLPGKQCNFGDGYACINEFRASIGNRIIFVSVHSGYGGEGDELRNLFEGTGINMGLFEPGIVLNIIQSLSGTAVEIAQGDTKINGLALTSITRIPPEHFTAYTALPIEEGLDYAVQNNLLDPNLLNQDLLIIETCGWRLPGETQLGGLNATSNSVYLVLVTLENHQSVNN
jgi:hypothetical protein